VQLSPGRTSDTLDLVRTFTRKRLAKPQNRELDGPKNAEIERIAASCV
jgi:hypothetical protein